MHALAWRIRHWLVRHYSLTPRVFFSECVSAHSVPVALGTGSSGLPSRKLTVNSVRGLF